MPFTVPQSKITRARLTINGPQVNSTGGGNILYGWPINPTTATEWSNYSGLYEEARLIGGLLMLCTYPPLVTSSSSVLNSIMFVAFDPTSSYTPTSVDDVINYGNRSELQVISLDREPFRYGFKYPTVGGNTMLPWFSTTATFTPSSCILLAADHVTAGNTYFDFFVDLYIEFRSRA